MKSIKMFEQFIDEAVTCTVKSEMSFLWNDDTENDFECTWKINGKKGKSFDESGEEFADAIANVMGVETLDLMDWFENKYDFSIVRASYLELKGTKGNLESFDGKVYEID